MCCGRQAFSTQDPVRHATAAAPVAPVRDNTFSAAARFEYTGKTALTVVSPLTGRKYRFRHPGECLDVELRDQSWLPFVPNLRRATVRNSFDTILQRG